MKEILKGKYDIEYIPAEIRAKRSSNDNCLCDMCHNFGYVTKLSYSTTRYYNHRVLSQRKNSIWMCDECLRKVRETLEVVDLESEVGAFPDDAEDRTKEGLTRQECADLWLVGAEIKKGADDE